MTREEAKAYFKRHIDLYCVTGICKEAEEMAIQALEQTQWIPCSERLPEANKAVLTYVDTGASETYCLAYWNDNRNGWEEWIGIRMVEDEMGYKVIAWMPLPQPYKGEKV